MQEKILRLYFALTKAEKRQKTAKMADATRQLPDGPLTADFVICDNTINRYGWRLLVQGIDTTGFMKNPVCCLQHNTLAVPVGKWLKLWVDNNQLKGTVEFDRNDPDAVKLYWKYKDGYMSAVSLNILPISESDDPDDMLPGQKYETITKSELLEVSLVTLPGNKNAVKLSTPEGKVFKLNLITKQMAKEEKTVEQLQAELAASRALNADNLIALHKQRGVVADGEVEPLKALALIDYENVNKMLSARKTVEKQADTTKDQLADQLVSLHATRLALTDDEKKMYLNSAKLNYEDTKKALEARKGKETVDTFMLGGLGGKQGTHNPDDRSGWTYLDYYKKDPDALQLMAKEQPEAYKKLEADFLNESKKLGITTTREE